MQGWLLDYLLCPTCRVGELSIECRIETRILQTGPRFEEVLVTGILACGNCVSHYPVLAEAPRLVPERLFTPEERAVSRFSGHQTVNGGEAMQLDPRQFDELLEQQILHDYGWPKGGAGRVRALQALDYQRTYARNRAYQMQIVHGLLRHPVEVILDVGGGIGGNLRAAAEQFPLRYGIVADLSTDKAPFFQTGNRRLAYVRADATRLPFRTGCVDLVVSSFLLEHVHSWKEVISEVTRVGRTAYVAFGPNRAFPMELGHLDAPLVHAVPGPIGLALAFIWGRVTGNRRSLHRIRTILKGMNYITSRAFYSYCRTSRLVYQNIFPNIVEAWSRSTRAGIRGWLGRRPTLVRAGAAGLTWLGLEPNIYSVLARRPRE